MTEPTTHANVAVMTNVLVTYASKHGSTAEIAEAVAERLQEHGLRAECVDVAEAASLEPYDAVVLGSAVYMKRWRGDARHFLRKHGKELSRLPFWVFSSGPTGDPAKDDPSWIEPKSVARKAEALGAREHIVFGGRVPADPKGPMQRAMVEGTPPEHRDRRDWAAIRAWASDIAGDLEHAEEPQSHQRKETP